MASAPVTVGVLAINDFHGRLEPPHQSVLAPDGKGGTVQVPAGGAAWLASAIDRLRAKYPDSLTVSAGDLIGASSVTSGLFLDEPSVELANRIGIDFNAVGNHEFDAGPAELKRKQAGGCEQYTRRKPCAVEPFRGAQFPFLAANTLTGDGTPLFPATGLKSFGTGANKVTIGVIGITTTETASLSSPALNRSLHWADEADTINALTPRLKAAGADVVMVLIHQGGRTRADPPQVPDPNRCDNFTGGIVPILNRLNPDVDLVVSGHTHWAYVCEYPVPGRAKPLLVTSAGLWGEEVTDITLRIDPATHRLVDRGAHNVIVQSPGYKGAGGFVAETDLYPGFEPRADIAAYVKRYVDAAAQEAQRRVGWLAGPALKSENNAASSGGPLGKLIADSQLAAGQPAGAQIAFMNPFGVRTSLIPAADGAVTFGQIYAVEPFQNDLVTLSYTGAEIKAILEQGFDDNGPEQILTPSAGFTYSYDRSRPIGSRIAAMTLDGKPLDMGRTYRVTISEYLANGGDTFTLFTKGRDPARGMIDVDALEAWLKPSPPRAVPQDKREIDLAPQFDKGDPNKVNPPGVRY
jgi:5'-nucleotidase